MKTEHVEDDCFCTDDSPVSKKLFGDVKTERVDNDCLRTDDDHIQYDCNNRNLPKFSEEVFKEKLVKTKLIRIKETAMFVVQQNLIHLKHPYDIKADDTPGSFIKEDQVCFYQATISDDRELSLSTEVHVRKNNKGNIVGGTYNRCENGKWKSTTANLSKLYAVI